MESNEYQSLDMVGVTGSIPVAPTSSGQQVASLEEEELTLSARLWQNLSTDEWWRTIERLREVRAAIADLEAAELDRCWRVATGQESP